MNQPLLIVITGKPGAGKTTLGRKIAGKLNLPFLHKDGIKEVLFERLGSAENDHEEIFPKLSYDLLYYFLDITTAAQQSLIIESNFIVDFDSPKITELQKRYHFKIFQILCEVTNDIAIERFVARLAAGERHPGHADAKKFDRLMAAQKEAREYRLDLRGELYVQDMNDFSTIDYDLLLDRIIEYRDQDAP